MHFYAAPMEGLTDHIFRNLHHQCFPGVDKYFMPFFSPVEDGRFTPRSLRDLEPRANEGVPVVPQLLTKRPEDFLWAAQALGDMGYTEVNLNLGCPSGTVVGKGKGSGLLSDLEGLERLLEGIFAPDLPLHISVKTRLGRYDADEFPRLLELFNRYPIYELTVHCRIREDFYRRPAQPDRFALPLAESRNPVCYNGDLVTQEKFRDFAAVYPATPAVMLGRGLIADPALIRRCQGGAGVEREELRSYLARLYEGYCSDFGSRRNALNRMKEVWFYQICLFEGAEKYQKDLRKATEPTQYEGIVERIFAECPLYTAGAQPTW